MLFLIKELSSFIPSVLVHNHKGLEVGGGGVVGGLIVLLGGLTMVHYDMRTLY